MCLGKIFNSPRNEKVGLDHKDLLGYHVFYPPGRQGILMERPWNQIFNL